MYSTEDYGRGSRGDRLETHGKQHIWVVSELYYPELRATGNVPLTDIAEKLAQAHRVSVLCAQPSYWARGVRAPSFERRNDVDVRRCWGTTFDRNNLYLRLFNLVTLSASIFCSALIRFRRKDIVIAVTNPPLLPYLMALVCRLRGARLVLRIEDVYPEVFVRLDILKQNSIFGRLMDRASRWLHNMSSRSIVLGRDMRKLVMQKLDRRPERVIVAPNWGDTYAVFPQPLSENNLLSRLHLNGKFVIQYCGNIGRTHGITDLTCAAELLLCKPDYQFLVIGWGAKRRWLVEQKIVRQLVNLTILDHLPPEEFCDGLNACNIALITFLSGMSGISVPSRMYDVMASGKPLIAVCDDDSELALVVKEEEIGWVIPPGRPDLIASTICEAKDNPDLLHSMGLRARTAAEQKYTRNSVLQTYEAIIESVMSE